MLEDLGPPLEEDGPAAGSSLGPDILEQMARLWSNPGYAAPTHAVHAYLDDDPESAGRDADRSEPPAPPSTDVNDIARELGVLAISTEDGLKAARRTFALRNHPDAVPPEMRAVATLRMSIANALLDQTRQRLTSGH